MESEGHSAVAFWLLHFWVGMLGALWSLTLTSSQGKDSSWHPVLCNGCQGQHRNRELGLTWVLSLSALRSNK